MKNKETNWSNLAMLAHILIFIYQLNQGVCVDVCFAIKRLLAAHGIGALQQFRITLLSEWDVTIDMQQSTNKQHSTKYKQIKKAIASI